MQIYKELQNILPSNKIKVNESLKHHTTLRIGGYVDYLVVPSSTNEVINIIQLCNEEKIDFFIIGNGSNLLVSDEGYRGIIMKIGNDFANISINATGTVTAQAGAKLPKLANTMAKNCFTGFEFASGIPATLGGAITMNAGAYDGEIGNYVVSAKIVDTSGKVITLTKNELELGYRTSILQKKKHILLEVDMKFTRGNQQDILTKMQKLNQLRRDSQPLNQLSAGSIFKRSEGYLTWKLISNTGLRGYRIGDAVVSDKHCVFIINKGKATSKDFISLIRHIIRTVYDRCGIMLEPEIHFLGNFEE